MTDEIESLIWFDLHCDTLSACEANGLSLYENNLHIDIKRGTALAAGPGCWSQVFACFLPDALSVDEAWALFLRQREVLLTALSLHPEQASTENSTICKAILAIEGGRLIGNDHTKIKLLSKMGVRLLTLVWNGENDLARGASSPGKMLGLTAFGKEAIPTLEDNGIIVDISHLSDKGVEDVFSIAKKPVVATHSNARSICNHARNLNDQQLTHLIKTNGLCGINFFPPFVKEDSNDYTLQELHAHIDHILSLGGEDILAIGSDFDGASMPSFIPDISGLYSLYSAVVGWYKKPVADKIFYKNARRVLEAER